MPERRPDRFPRLAADEARRLVVVAVLCVVSLIPALASRVVGAPSSEVSAGSADAAHRLDGNVHCGAGQAGLSASEALLMGVPLDVDTADAQALQMIPGVGVKLAQRIIEDRNKNGTFGGVANVRRVRGIGPKLTATISRYAR